MGSNMFNLEKLVGRENFATWKFSMKTYLEHEDLWCCVECPKDKPVDASKDVKAKSKLILLLDPQNYVHVQECKTAKQVWDSLQRAFDDNGLTRRVGLLKDLINTTLESSNSVEDYVSKIMNTAHKLRNIGFEVNDEWLGTLMLAGLPKEYKPMIMGLESSGIQINADSVKSKLIQEINTSKSTAFYSNTKKKGNNVQPLKSKGPRCFTCNKIGHFAKFCKQPKKQSASKEKAPVL
ncbi:Retrovirus-related Pol polyprotein from transposon TNT 1-94 [Eumeta japonica]|uniref:Retrovirus-related Pol polyprotein from transposon TNT 1-94 n=1 Tax=Eumeta variegata TaxID=151549 RepID=A0A4C1U7V9_EUMVA|nr:Retrovirus-related Pol polyprotein from transposon TNT 1-94 [Eumeta japonica]